MLTATDCSADWMQRLEFAFTGTMGGIAYVTLKDASDSDGDVGEQLRRHGAEAEAGDVVA